MTLRCSKCDKRLSRKFARLIDGKVLCSGCMFAPAQVDRSPQGQDAQRLDRNDESAVRSEAKDAPND